MIFFTSDTHYAHKRIIEYSKRPFGDIHEMREVMVARWNAVVGCNDTVYHLGDVSFQRNDPIVWRLNGTKVLVAGNHDRKGYPEGFEEVCDYRVLRVEGEKLVLFHFPISSWEGMHRGSWHLHGHSHGSHRYSWPMSRVHGKRMDVGVDCHDFTPVSFAQVKAIMGKLAAGEPTDHHT